MNNDLISRSAVIKGIDELLKSPYANNFEFGFQRRDAMGTVKDLCVRECPTAYNVEKVLEKLEDYHGLIPGWALNEIIETVKSGFDPIEAQSTAYDVDEVIEQMDKAISAGLVFYRNGTPMFSREQIIEIIRRGR